MIWILARADQLIALAPADVERRLRQGHALLIDTREPDEFARRHIEGAVSPPLLTLGSVPLPALPGAAMVYACKTGMLAGGVDGWAKAGPPVVANPEAPLAMMRQAQIAASLLVLSGVLLGWFVAPVFFVHTGFVGARLTVAGVAAFAAWPSCWP